MELFINLLLNLGIGLIFFLITLPSIFWVVMLIDVVKRDFPNSNDKIIWILILIFTQLVGSIIYYFLIKAKAPKNSGFSISLNSLITIPLLLIGPFSFLFGLIGILLMWFWTKWPKKWKIIITLTLLLIYILIFAIIFLAAFFLQTYSSYMFQFPFS